MAYPYDPTLLSALYLAHMQQVVQSQVPFPVPPPMMPHQVPKTPFGTGYPMPPPMPARVPQFGYPYPPPSFPVPPPSRQSSHSTQSVAQHVPSSSSSLKSTRTNTSAIWADSMPHPVPTTRSLPVKIISIKNKAAPKVEGVEAQSHLSTESLVKAMDKYIGIPKTKWTTDLEANIDLYLSSSSESDGEEGEHKMAMQASSDNNSINGGSSGFESGSRSGPRSEPGTDPFSSSSSVSEDESDFGPDYALYIREMKNLLANGSIADVITPGSAYQRKVKPLTNKQQSALRELDYAHERATDFDLFNNDATTDSYLSLMMQRF